MSQNILLVEDAPLIQQMYRGTLAAAGFSVQVAANGVEALKILSAGYRADLVLLDLNMPVMDGFKVLQVIRSDARLKEIPVVVFSTRGQPGEVRQAMELGATAYVIKATTKPAQVIETIRNLLQKQDQPARASHYLLEVSPATLDAPDFARFLGVKDYRCPKCRGKLLFDVVPVGERESRTFSGTVLCPACEA